MVVGGDAWICGKVGVDGGEGVGGVRVDTDVSGGPWASREGVARLSPDGTYIQSNMGVLASGAHARSLSRERMGRG